MNTEEPKLKQDVSKAFYESKGLIRHMVILKVESKEKLKDVSKMFHLTQGELVDALIERADVEELASYLKNKRADVIKVRAKKSDLAKQIKNLSPEQLSAIEAIVGKLA